MEEINDYLVVSDEDLKKVVAKVNDLIKNNWYTLYWDLFVVQTNYKLNIVLNASGSYSWWEWWGSYSGNNNWAWNPTWKNIYHQVLIHYRENNSPVYREDESGKPNPIIWFSH